MMTAFDAATATQSKWIKYKKARKWNSKYYEYDQISDSIFCVLCQQQFWNSQNKQFKILDHHIDHQHKEIKQHDRHEYLMQKYPPKPEPTKLIWGTELRWCSRHYVSYKSEQEWWEKENGTLLRHIKKNQRYQYTPDPCDICKYKCPCCYPKHLWYLNVKKINCAHCVDKLISADGLDKDGSGWWRRVSDDRILTASVSLCKRCRCKYRMCLGNKYNRFCKQYGKKLKCSTKGCGYCGVFLEPTSKRNRKSRWKFKKEFDGYLLSDEYLSSVDYEPEILATKIDGKYYRLICQKCNGNATRCAMKKCGNRACGDNVFCKNHSKCVICHNFTDNLSSTKKGWLRPSSYGDRYYAASIRKCVSCNSPVCYSHMDENKEHCSDCEDQIKGAQMLDTIRSDINNDHRYSKYIRLQRRNASIWKPKTDVLCHQFGNDITDVILDYLIYDKIGKDINVKSKCCCCNLFHSEQCRLNIMPGLDKEIYIFHGSDTQTIHDSYYQLDEQYTDKMFEYDNYYEAKYNPFRKGIQRIGDTYYRIFCSNQIYYFGVLMTRTCEYPGCGNMDFTPLCKNHLRCYQCGEYSLFTKNNVDAMKEWLSILSIDHDPDAKYRVFWHGYTQRLFQYIFNMKKCHDCIKWFCYDCYENQSKSDVSSKHTICHPLVIDRNSKPSPRDYDVKQCTICVDTLICKQLLEAEKTGIDNDQYIQTQCRLIHQSTTCVSSETDENISSDVIFNRMGHHLVSNINCSVAGMFGYLRLCPHSTNCHISVISGSHGRIHAICLDKYGNKTPETPCFYKLAEDYIIAWNETNVGNISGQAIRRIGEDYYRIFHSKEAFYCTNQVLRQCDHPQCTNIDYLPLCRNHLRCSQCYKYVLIKHDEKQLLYDWIVCVIDNMEASKMYTDGKMFRLMKMVKCEYCMEWLCKKCLFSKQHVLRCYSEQEQTNTRKQQQVLLDKGKPDYLCRCAILWIYISVLIGIIMHW